MERFERVQPAAQARAKTSSVEKVKCRMVPPISKPRTGEQVQEITRWLVGPP